VSLQSIISEIDAEIARLEQAKQLLTGITTKRGPGRPRLNTIPTPAPKKRARRTLSAAGRARIAAAQKARWANLRKAAGKSAPKVESAK
jgi:hypothetical protein